MRLLKSELVKKYFGYAVDGGLGCAEVYPLKADIALRVLEAMEQPIKKGEKYLMVQQQTLDPLNVTEYECIGDNFKGSTFHPIALRLPDRFQEQPPAKGCEPEKLLTCPI